MSRSIRFLSVLSDVNVEQQPVDMSRGQGHGRPEGGKGGGHVPPGSSEQWFFRAKTQNFPGHPHQHLYGDLRITLPPWIFFLRTPMVRAEGLEKTGNLQS